MKPALRILFATLVGMVLISATKPTDSNLSATEWLNLGVDEMKEYRLPDAIEALTMAMMKAREKDENKILLRVYANLGNIYDLYGDFRLAVYYYSLAFQMANHLGETFTSVKVAQSLVMPLCRLSQIEEAEKYHDYAASIPVDTLRQEVEYHQLINGSTLAVNKEQYKEAMELANKAEAISSGLGLDYKAGAISQKLRVLMEQNGPAEEMILQSTRIISLCDSFKMPQYLVNAYSGMWNGYLMEGDSANYRKYLSLYYNMNDSVFKPLLFKNASSILNLNEKEWDRIIISGFEQKVKHQYLLIFAAIVLILSAVTVIIVIYRQKKRLAEAYQALYKKNEQALNPGSTDTEEETDEEEANPVKEEPKEYSLTLDPTVMEEVARKIIEILDDEKNIVNPDFSLVDLSQLTSVNTRYLSHVMNSAMNTSFKTLLNSRRVALASRLLKENSVSREENIKTIALQAGFNSSNSFISIFKKHVGMTPGTYMKIARKEAEKS